MEIKPGLSALVTGGASGIGRAVALALAAKGIFVTIVDVSEQRGKEVQCLLHEECKKFHPFAKHPLATFIKCDVTKRSAIAAAFGTHVEVYGGLDICVNSSGIVNPIPFHNDDTDGTKSWRHTLDVNLIAVINCTRLAVQAMEARKNPGVVINLASAAGLYPSYADPIYSSSKAGVVMFTRALVPFKHKGIRINALCPEFVQTDMGSKVDSKLLDLSGGFLPMEMIVNCFFKLIADESKAGACLWISNRSGMQYWPMAEEEKKYLIKKVKPRTPSTCTPLAKIELPNSFKKVVIHTFSHNFRSATKIVRAQINLPIKPNHVLVKIIYAGVNASDVNFSSGHYFSHSDNGTASHVPYDAGFEGVGLIAAVGDSVHNLTVGLPVAVMAFGSYSEFIMVPSKHIIPVARPEPEVVAMLTSGLTASIALEMAGRMKSGEVILVTAAAGGTGQFAVQLAKLAGNKVIATCGGEEKAALLKSLGADRVIDYRTENIKEVLKKEYPKGVDIVYESVGGSMFDKCLNALATYGRLIVIGMISQYQGEHGWKPLNYTGLCEKILAKSQTVAGFFLLQHAHLWQQHMDKLTDLFTAGKLKVALDPKEFVGLGSVADAVEYLHSGKSIGKVVVCVDPAFSRVSPKL